mgnify:CR=1 FL=1
MIRNAEKLIQTAIIFCGVIKIRNGWKLDRLRAIEWISLILLSFYWATVEDFDWACYIGDGGKVRRRGAERNLERCRRYG